MSPLLRPVSEIAREIAPCTYWFGKEPHCDKRHLVEGYWCAACRIRPAIERALLADRKAVRAECLDWVLAERRDDGTAQRIEAHLRAIDLDPKEPQ